MEKLSIGSKNAENSQVPEEKCPSEHSEETELCSCKLSELDMCSTVTDSSCFAKVIEKLLDQHKSREEQLIAEKQQLVNNFEIEKARADQAEQAIVELKKEKAVWEEEKCKFEDEKRQIGKEKHEFDEEKKKQKNMNAFISSSDYHIFSEYVQHFTRKSRTHYRHLAISDDSDHWNYTSSEPILSSRFKLYENFDGTIGIYSTSKGKFLENGQNGYGLTEDSSTESAKFEFVYVGEDELYDNNRMVKIRSRSMYGNGYLRLDQGHVQSYDFYVTSTSTCKDATVFTLVPAYDLGALLKK